MPTGTICQPLQGSVPTGAETSLLSCCFTCRQLTQALTHACRQGLDENPSSDSDVYLLVKNPSAVATQQLVWRARLGPAARR